MSHVPCPIFSGLGRISSVVYATPVESGVRVSSTRHTSSTRSIFFRFDYRVILSFLALTFQAAAQDASPDGASSVESKPFTATGTVVFSSVFPTYIPPVELGELPAGGTTEVILEVANHSNDSFTIQEARTSCSCIEVKSSEPTIGAGKSIQVKVDLKVPTMSRSAVQGQTINLIGKQENTSIPIHLSYKTKGLCCFAEPSVTKIVPLDVRQVDIEVPLLLSAPVNPKLVTASGSGDFENITPVIQQRGEGVFLKCTVPVPSGDGFSIVGVLMIKNSINNGTDSIQCFVTRQKKASIYPKLIQFVQDGNEWKGAAMVRIHPDAMSKGDDKEELSIACSVGKLGFKVSSTVISKGIARVKLSVKDTDVFVDGVPRFNLSEKLEWQIGWEGGIAELQTSVKFR